MLKNHAYIFANVLIILFVILGFAGMQMNELSYYREVANEQAINEVELTAKDINFQISNIATEQRLLSQMMANDIFLKEWCETETEDIDSEHTQFLYEYLNEYKEAYDYDVVFFVSNKTYNYYYDGGFNKVVSAEDDFDVWYFNFLELNEDYDIQIDHDEVNEFGVSLFVNCVVKDENGEILGVVGCGNGTDDFQTSLDEIAYDYNVEIGIVNVGNAHNSFEGSSGYYKTVSDAMESLGISEDEVTMDVGDEGYSWTNGSNCNFIINNDELNWNIIVQKDTTEIVSGLLEHMYNRVIFLVVLLVLYIVISTTFLSKISRYSRKNENTDEITGMINNKMFREMFEKSRKKGFQNKETCLVLLDVDDFKTVNDNYGHLYGNTVLKTVSEELKHAIGSDGFIARWGGDEFVGLIYLDKHIVFERLNLMQELLQQMDTKVRISFSCGIVEIDRSVTLKEAFEKADRALYKAKENGKAQCYLSEAEE